MDLCIRTDFCYAAGGASGLCSGHSHEGSVVVLGRYRPRGRLLLCRGVRGSVTVTHTRIARMLHLW